MARDQALLSPLSAHNQCQLTAGHCYWEHATNGCSKGAEFTRNAYDFYALCREGEHKEAEFQCKGKPANLKQAQCKDRPKPENKKALKHESSSSNSKKEGDEESEYRDYYYLKGSSNSKKEGDDESEYYPYYYTTETQKYCFHCEHSA